LGVFYYGGFSNVWPEIRLVGVLPRLAFTYGIAAVLYLNLNLRGLIITAISILAGYWILLSFVPVPGVGVPSVAPDAHWPKYIDEFFLPGQTRDGTWDNCGILGTFPAVVNVLLGIFASLILKEKTIQDKKKALYLVGGGLILVVSGYLWSFQLPIIKKIWTPSYVFVSGGYSLILMGLFYWIIDIMHFKKWTLIFVWIGVNPITIYMLTNIFSFHRLAGRFVGGNIQMLVGEKFFPLLLNAVSFTLILLLLRFMYNKKIFIKV
jgi:predicted acyltransferase